MLDPEKRITTKAQLKEWLSVEEKYYKTSLPVYVLQLSEKAVLRRHQRLLRKTEYYHNTNKKIPELIYKVFLNRIQIRYTLRIPLNCCGKGFKIMHLAPIGINTNAVIGENCTMHINTFIAPNGTSGKSPVIGDGCVIGIGAIVMGDVHLANNTAVGAGAVVTKSFEEENIAVAGVPAKKISNNGRLNWNKK